MLRKGKLSLSTRPGRLLLVVGCSPRAGHDSSLSLILRVTALGSICQCPQFIIILYMDRVVSAPNSYFCCKDRSDWDSHCTIDVHKRHLDAPLSFTL